MREIGFEIEPLEQLDAPGVDSWLAGIGAGIVVGGVALGVGIAIT